VRAAGPSGATAEGMMHAPRRANLQMPLRDQVPLIGWSRPSTALPSEVACPRRAPLGACVADVGRCLVGHGGGVTLSSGGVSEFPRSGWPYLGDLRERSCAAGASPPRTLEAVPMCAVVVPTCASAAGATTRAAVRRQRRQRRRRQRRQQRRPFPPPPTRRRDAACPARCCLCGAPPSRVGRDPCAPCAAARGRRFPLPRGRRRGVSSPRRAGTPRSNNVVGRPSAACSVRLG